MTYSFESSIVSNESLTKDGNIVHFLNHCNIGYPLQYITFDNWNQFPKS